MKTKLNSWQILKDQLPHLEMLNETLKTSQSEQEKLQILDQQTLVSAYIADCSVLKNKLPTLSPLSQVVIKSILAIGQNRYVFGDLAQELAQSEEFETLLSTLEAVQNFYAPIGGIVGYHLAVLKLLIEKNQETATATVHYSKPIGLDISIKSLAVQQVTRQGIEALPLLAEIYPVGGAGDRLQLKDEVTKEPLPVAQMQFCGITLLEWLVRDLQAREYLYYKLTGEQLLTPIAMMTSLEKNNHERIIQICQQNQWFGRPKEAFRFFMQPLVPMVSEEGQWCVSAPLKLILKPGGHGVIWKLAKDKQIFSWFQSLNRQKAVIRQINNPISGTDNGLLAFAGVGCQGHKKFGFASCFRALNAAEGMNVLIEQQGEGGYFYTISNVEYTDFAQKGIEDVPAEPGSHYSAFPANTNVLFADLNKLAELSDMFPIPGTILNMKNAVECLDASGNKHLVRAGRLESTMQNIADHMRDFVKAPLTDQQQNSLETFVTYNQRRRTISVTKKSYTGQSIQETPEGCYYDLQFNTHELLSQHCQMTLPPFPDAEAFMSEFPPTLLHLHPALGPLFDIMAQKIQGGRIEPGSEMTLHLAELYLAGLTLQGALRVHAQQWKGQQCNKQQCNKQQCNEQQNGQIGLYGEHSGKCVLKNVTVKNKGLDYTTQQIWWKGSLRYHERLEIVLQGNGEFYAENVVFKGAQRIEVPDGYRYTAVVDGETFRLVKAKIEQPSWYWHYAFDADHQIQLTFSHS